MSKNKLPISKNRKPLYTLLPLNTPLTIYIDPSSACNFSCKFCYQNSIEKKIFNPQIMKWDIFEKVIEDIKEFDSKIKMIHLYGYGEPLLNPNFPQMIKKLKRKISQNV